MSKSEKGTELLNKIEESGLLINCPQCGNKNFYASGGFLDKDGEMHAKKTNSSIKSIMVLMCNECLYFNYKVEKL